MIGQFVGLKLDGLTLELQGTEGTIMIFLFPSKGLFSSDTVRCGVIINAITNDGKFYTFADGKWQFVPEEEQMLDDEEEYTLEDWL